MMNNGKPRSSKSAFQSQSNGVLADVVDTSVMQDKVRISYDFGTLRLLQIDDMVGEEKASRSSHFLRPIAKEVSASHGNSFAIFYYVNGSIKDLLGVHLTESNSCLFKTSLLVLSHSSNEKLQKI